MSRGLREWAEEQHGIDTQGWRSTGTGGSRPGRTGGHGWLQPSRKYYAGVRERVNELVFVGRLGCVAGV